MQEKNREIVFTGILKTSFSGHPVHVSNNLLLIAVAGDEAQVLRQDPGTPAPGQCGAQPLPEQMKTSLASLTVAVLPRSHWLFGPLAHAHAPPLCI